MKITLELLKKYGASNSIIEYFEKSGLEGAALIEIMDTENINFEFLYFLRKFIPFNEEEEAKYNKICHITNSKNVWRSQQIENSSDIMRAIRISDSTKVRDSSDITSSSFVFNSKVVDNSTNVKNSGNIVDSDKVIKSNNITDSEQVACSSYIDWSDNIFYSISLTDCGYVYQSENLSDSYFCGFVKNSNHCLFCTNIEDKSFYIFNKEVEPQIFEEVLEQLHLMLQAETPRMIEIAEDKFDGEERFNFNARYDSVFNGLSKEFYGWVGTLPNYSDDVFVELFFRDRNEKI